MALTATRSPSLNPRTAVPSLATTPTASWPSVRSARSPMAPPTVWVSDVQTIAAVVFTTASLGPGSGTGFSARPTSPTRRITNALIVRAITIAPCTCRGDTRGSSRPAGRVVEEDRRRGPAEDPLRHAPRHQPPQPAAAVRGHGDEDAGPAPGRRRDRLRRVPGFHDLRPDVEPFPAGADGDPLQ